jgi:hemin uptake protein HemP
MASEPLPDEKEQGGSLPGDPGVRLPKIVPFRELCRCGDEVWIENDGELYRLRRTRQGKLILTK